MDAVLSRDGADDTPLEINVWPTAGQLLARILDGTAQERLVVCAALLTSMKVAARCEECNHRGQIAYLEKQLHETVGVVVRVEPPRRRCIFEWCADPERCSQGGSCEDAVAIRVARGG